MLDTDVIQLGPFLHDQVVDAAGQSRGPVGTAEAIDNGGFAVALADHEGVRKDCGIFAFNPVENFDRLRDFKVLGHTDEDAIDRARAVQGRVFDRAEFDFLRHEMLLHQVGVLRGGLLEGHDNEAGFDQIRGRCGNGKKAVVAKDEAGG